MTHIGFKTACQILSDHQAKILVLQNRTRFCYFGGVSALIEIRKDTISSRFDLCCINGQLVGNRTSAMAQYTLLCIPALEQIAHGELKPAGFMADVKNILWPEVTND